MPLGEVRDPGAGPPFSPPSKRCRGALPLACDAFAHARFSGGSDYSKSRALGDGQTGRAKKARAASTAIESSCAAIPESTGSDERPCKIRPRAFTLKPDVAVGAQPIQHGRMDKNHDVRSEALTNRLLDEGIMLVVRAAELAGISISGKTAIRWCLAGVRGIRLENLKVRGRRMTTRAAMRRFIAATQDRVPQDGPASSVPVLNDGAVDRILASYGLGRDSKR